MDRPDYTPKQIADLLQVSTTTLRRYEDQGLIPDVPRSASRRRGYTLLHVQAFRTIRALLKAYDFTTAYDMMRHIKAGQTEKAMWLMNEQQFNLQEEKRRVESVIKMIRDSNLTKSMQSSLDAPITIGEAAKVAGVNASAIRHWEKEGLIQTERNLENGYRVFNKREVEKIIVISSLRKTVYSIDRMKELLHNLDIRNMASLDKAFRLALEQLDHRLVVQFQAMPEVMEYMNAITSPVT
ncbi:MerR family transcriptional regulator [Paenibacillus daejeonensis]|uniref:MerR family transcriptional regulator n=1 Tax=Paenibacillus daejeonensis TaxID=135193 RepID=UPI00035D2717|nr:MerR family transcriptional regulator [Paenibacillus daejeonensis]